MKIKLAILEKDSSYLNRIVTVFNAKYADKLEVYSFTDESVALKTLNEAKIEVLVANDAFEIDVKSLPSRCGFAYFVDSADIETLREQPAICKFQKADLIYKQILSIYSENAANMTGMRFDEDSTKMFLFTAMSGGVGSSTMAASFAVHLAQQMKKVLYLNFEYLGSSTMFFSGEGQFDFGDVIYALKSKKANLNLKLESTVRQSGKGVYYFAPTKVALDVMELSNNDIKRLLKSLRMSGTYEYIVIDAEFRFDEKGITLWKEVNDVVLISDGSDASNIKLERAYNSLNVMEQQDESFKLSKAKILYNKFSNKFGKTMSGLDIKEIGGIPRFEHATTEQVVEQVSSMEMLEKIL